MQLKDRLLIFARVAACVSLIARGVSDRARKFLGDPTHDEVSSGTGQAQSHVPDRRRQGRPLDSNSRPAVFALKTRLF